MNSTKIYLIHDGTLDLQLLSEITKDQNITILHWNERNSIPLNARVLLYISDEQIKELILIAIEKQWEIALLIHPGANYAVRALGAKGNLKSLINHYFQTEAIESDVLTCNDQVVLNSVAIGKVHSLRPYDASHPPSGLSIIFSALKAIRILRLHNYTLTTAKDQKIHFAALGMVVVDQTQSSLIGGCFSEVLSNIDDRLTLLTFSPRSVLSYLWVLFLLVIPKKISLTNLPDSIGLIRSKHIQLEADKEIEYLLDGASVTAQTIQFQVLDLKLRIIPGPALIHGEENNLVSVHPLMAYF
jgi:diacylglycerol kinase family enzyme